VRKCFGQFNAQARGNSSLKRVPEPPPADMCVANPEESAPKVIRRFASVVDARLLWQRGVPPSVSGQGSSAKTPRRGMILRMPLRGATGEPSALRPCGCFDMSI
jgi:hypothetical protein